MGRNVMKQDYELILTSYPDCEDFVVEIWLENNLAAIVKENNEVQQSSSPVHQAAFDSGKLADAINRAKKMLLGTRD